MRSGRHRREAEFISYQFPSSHHSRFLQNLLPPPLHSQTELSPSSIAPNYDRSFEHHNEGIATLPPRCPVICGETHDDEYVESLHPKFPRSYGVSLPALVTYEEMPVHANNAYNGIRRSHSCSSPRAFRLSELSTTRGHGITQTDAMCKDQSDKSREMHPGFNPSQETVVTSHNERRNGREYEGHQMWPPPVNVLVQELPFYNNNSEVGY